MMYKVGQFEKVSYEQFTESINLLFNKDEINKIYSGIKLPQRATKGSAGYDFFVPYSIILKTEETVKISTGIKVKIEDGWFLSCYPRSSLGFKYRLQLDNTVGIIDSDYYYSDNGGHIFAKITNDSKEEKTITLNTIDRFMQGIFLPYGITYNDNTTGIRNGGLGSTVS